MDFKILRLVLGDLGTNCYVIFDNDKNAIIIDPAAESRKIIKACEDNELNVKKIVLTHAHADHFGAINEVKEYFNATSYVSKNDSSLLRDKSRSLMEYLRLSGEIVADELLEDKDTVECGDLSLKVIATPGHTPGGICLLIDKVLFSGDTLFYGSIGRTDLPGGSFNQILESLEKLMELEDDVIVLPGHGEQTSIGFERTHNPYIR